MTAALRRTTLYVLLLLGPALAIGGGALWLLQREQNRLQAEARAAREARQEAVAARVRLIAENLGVLLADMQTSLNEILASAPRQAPQRYLQELQTSNPFVRAAFLVDAQGRLIWGEAMPAVAKVGAAAEESFETSDRDPSGDSLARPQAAANVAQYQAARSDFRAEVQQKSLADTERRKLSGQGALAAPAPAAEPEGADTLRDRAGTESIAWIPEMAARPPRLWVRRSLADGAALGLQVDLAELRTRLEAVFPAELEVGERYELLAPEETRPRPLDLASDYEAMARKGLPARAELALSPTLLPGWRVAGARTDDLGSVGQGIGYVLLGAPLVVGLIVAIAVGGALLWRDARRQELETLRRTTFVANVSHEFKTPLTTIRLFAELLGQGRVAEPSRRNEYLVTIGEEAARLTRMVENVLRLGRLEAREHRLQKAACRMDEVVLAVVTRQRPQLEAAGLSVTLDLAEHLEPVEADRDAVQQILTNLLDNASKYGASGGQLNVRLGGGTDSGVEVEVADRGPGIPARERERIFVPFQRGDERLSADHGGAGLGLGIARSLARAHGGDLRYEPRAGGGARFILSLT